MIPHSRMDVAEVSYKQFADSPLGKASETKDFNRPTADYDKPLGIIVEKAKHCPCENGQWGGERGDSPWSPKPDYVPLKANPEGKTWAEIFSPYDIDSIKFKDGAPDFSEISKGTVEIFPFTDSRTDNFDKADIALAKEKGCTPEEVAKWRKENSCTWHECKDMKTMEKVPSAIHNNITHSGGISEAKKSNGEQA